MTSFNLKNLTSDSCLFNSDKYDIIILFYLDVILIMGKEVGVIIKIKTKLIQIFQMTDLGEVKNF